MNDKELKRLQRIADGLARQVERKVYIVEYFNRIEIVSEKELAAFYSGCPDSTFHYTADPSAAQSA
jgi:hypothetical protein